MQISRRKWVCRALLIVLIASGFLGCSGSDAASGQLGAGGSSSVGGAGSSDDGNSAGAPCATRRASFASAVAAPASCTSDSDCATYVAKCLQVESGNCAGIFSTAASSVAALDALESDYESCTGVQCGAGGGCGLGSLPPSCVNGLCK